jgi:hypothetical protein
MSEDASAASPAANVGAYRPKDPAALGRVVVAAVAAHLALTLLLILLEAVHLSVLARFEPGGVDPHGAYLPGEQIPSLLVGAGALAQLLALITSAFLSLKWIYRVSLNAHALADGMSMSPGWNVGWFFVPVANLWFPWKGIRESWAVSADPAKWKAVKRPPILVWWWGFWIVSGIAGSMAFRIQLNSGTVGAATASDMAVIVSDLLGVPTDLLFILVVRRLTAMQVGALASHALA